MSTLHSFNYLSITLLVPAEMIYEVAHKALCENGIL
jgi:hypothetical protein